MHPQQASHEYLAAQVDSADLVGRVALLHEGAARFTREAIRHIERRDFDQAHDAFTKAKRIILHLLSAVPDSDNSDLAAHFRGLFKYCYTQLVEGNLRKDPHCAEEALKVIRTLGEGWAGLGGERREGGASPSRDNVAYLV
jgi:flagellar protein FliS